MATRPPSEKSAYIAMNGCPVYLGTITADNTTAKNNSTTAVPFNFSQTDGANLAGMAVLVSPDANCYLLPGGISSAVTSATGLPVGQAERISMILGNSIGYLSVLGQTGTVNLQVWQLT